MDYKILANNLNIEHTEVDENDIEVVELPDHWSSGPTPTSFKKGHVPWNKGKKVPSASEYKTEYWRQWRLKNPNYKDKWKVYEKVGYNIEARSKRAKERNKIQVECPECGKVGQLANMKRWHFDNCKKPNVMNKDSNGRFAKKD